MTASWRKLLAVHILAARRAAGRMLGTAAPAARDHAAPGVTAAAASCAAAAAVGRTAPLVQLCTHLMFDYQFSVIADSHAGVMKSRAILSFL